MGFVVIQLDSGVWPPVFSAAGSAAGSHCAHPMGTGCQGMTTDRVQNTTDLSGGAFPAICFYMALDEQFQQSTRFTGHRVTASAEFMARLAVDPDHPLLERAPGQAVPPPEASEACSRGLSNSSHLSP